MLQVLPGVTQNKSQHFYSFPKSHLISKDPAGPLDSSERKLSDQAAIEIDYFYYSSTFY